MVESSVIVLADGDRVRVDYTATSPNLLAFQLLDPSGQAKQPEQTIEQGRDFGLTGQPFTHIDSFAVAPLSGGGFVVAFDERVTPTDTSMAPSETQNASVYDAHGLFQASFSQTVGTNIASGTGFASPILVPLSGDRFVLVSNINDGSTVTGIDLSIDSADRSSVHLVLTGSFGIATQAGAEFALSGASGGLVLVGGANGANLMGDVGADTVIGGTSPDVIRGAAGDDSLSGGSAFDDINGNMGNDTAHGNAGDDWVVGGKDQDVLFGDAGNDIVLGNLGNDTLDGGDGDDVVRGGQGDDVLTGGAGNDYISGDRGNDTETGGAGADNFHSFSGAGIDRVLDFNVSEGDRVQLDPGTQFQVSQVGADTIVDLGNGDEVILVGVQASTLPPGTIFLG
jgi:Ca2+-binding RTX toxin-like protein